MVILGRSLLYLFYLCCFLGVQVRQPSSFLGISDWQAYTKRSMLWLSRKTGVTAPNLQGMQRPTKAMDAGLLFYRFSELLALKFSPTLIRLWNPGSIQPPRDNFLETSWKVERRICFLLTLVSYCSSSHLGERPERNCYLTSTCMA